MVTIIKRLISGILVGIIIFASPAATSAQVYSKEEFDEAVNLSVPENLKDNPVDKASWAIRKMKNVLSIWSSIYKSDPHTRGFRISDDIIARFENKVSPWEKRMLLDSVNITELEENLGHMWHAYVTFTNGILPLLSFSQKEELSRFWQA